MIISLHLSLTESFETDVGGNDTIFLSTEVSDESDFVLKAGDVLRLDLSLLVVVLLLSCLLSFSFDFSRKVRWIF